MESNHLRKFYNKKSKRFHQLSAMQFSNVWNHFDKDCNGFIEGEELTNFISELIESLLPKQTRDELTPDQVEDLVYELLDSIDTNNDSRIDIQELAALLPTDEEFLFIFRNEKNLPSSVQFMKTWKEFDRDLSGFIEADELKEFLKKILTRPDHEPPSDDTIISYTDSILKIFDQNNDGKLQLSEMARLLPVEDNFLCCPIFKNNEQITMMDIEKIFKFYDQDRNGTIQDEELTGFLKDLLELALKDYDEDDLKYTKENLLNNYDLNNDGKINLDELKILLMAHVRNMEKDNQ